MIALCLAAALTQAAARIDLPDGRFSIRWVHSIEKIEWQEDWRATPAGLILDFARIKGSGAGMEPPDDAVHRDGWYEWHPRMPALPRVILGRSEFVPDHRLCKDRDCRSLSSYIGGSDPVTLEPCHAP